MDVLERLAILILSGELTFDALDQRLESCFESQRTFRHKLIHRLIEHFGVGSRPSIRAVKEWLSNDPALRRKKQRRITLYPDTLPVTMATDRTLSSDWNVLSICTIGKLAHWLDISPEELDWFSGEMHFTSGSTKLCHYNYKTIAKRSGAMRLLEIPKWRLKMIQRRILHGILDRIPSHDCPHGFKQARSIFSFTQPHKNKKVVLKFDLKDYFLSTERARVRSLFHLAGYPPTISRHLAGHAVIRQTRITCRTTSKESGSKSGHIFPRVHQAHQHLRTSYSTDLILDYRGSLKKWLYPSPATPMTSHFLQTSHWAINPLHRSPC